MSKINVKALEESGLVLTEHQKQQIDAFNNAQKPTLWARVKGFISEQSMNILLGAADGATIAIGYGAVKGVQTKMTIDAHENLRNNGWQMRRIGTVEDCDDDSEEPDAEATAESETAQYDPNAYRKC